VPGDSAQVIVPACAVPVAGGTEPNSPEELKPDPPELLVEQAARIMVPAAATAASIIALREMLMVVSRTGGLLRVLGTHRRVWRYAVWSSLTTFPGWLPSPLVTHGFRDQPWLAGWRKRKQGHVAMGTENRYGLLSMWPAKCARPHRIPGCLNRRFVSRAMNCRCPLLSELVYRAIRQRVSAGRASQSALRPLVDTKPQVNARLIGVRRADLTRCRCARCGPADWRRCGELADGGRAWARRVAVRYRPCQCWPGPHAVAGCDCEGSW